MRHNKKFNHLGRQSAHRKSMMANMASSLVVHKRINTTLAKAKALRMYVEPLITKCKEDTTHSRRIVFSYLKDKVAVAELFREVAPKVADRPGGYCRILKTGFRKGDAAEMCFIELVDFNAVYGEEVKGTAGATAPKTRRSRSGAKKSEGDADSILQEGAEVVATKTAKAAKAAPKKAAAAKSIAKPVAKPATSKAPVKRSTVAAKKG